MRVAVVGLADNHDGRLVVASRRHHTSHAIVDDLFQVFLTTEQDFDVLVKTTAAVEARVDDDTVTEVVFAEDLGVHIAVAGITHATDVDITQTAFGKFRHRLFIMLHPTVIEQFIHCSVADRLHGLVPSLATVGDGHEDGLSALVIQQRIIIHVFRNLHAVNLLNYGTRFHLRALLVEGTAFHHLSNLQAVTLIVEVKEHAKFSRSIAFA